MSRYHDVKDVVTNYIKTKTRFQQGSYTGPRRNGDWKKVFKGKGQGKGQGKSKGKVVVCFKGGGQGHIAPQCPSEYTEKGKGKGKHSKGKGEGTGQWKGQDNFKGGYGNFKGS